MSLTATDALFNLEYLALSFGSQIVENNVDNLTVENNVKISTRNQITVAGTPIAFGKAGVIGWYRKPTDTDWKLIKFVGQTATVNGLESGDVVCVKYNAIDNSAREIVVPTNIIPSEMKAILRQDLMLGEQGDISTYSKVGELVIEIPRFQLNVDQTLSMSMTGVN